MEWECFWVNLREDNKVSESKMAVSESNMAEFKMAAIIKLSQNEWMKFSCVNVGNYSWQVWVSLRGKTKMVESKMAKFKMAVFNMAAIINLSQNEWVKFILCKMAESMMAEIKMAAIIKLRENEWVKVFFVQNGWNKDGRIQDSCNHQVESIWMSQGFFDANSGNQSW